MGDAEEQKRMIMERKASVEGRNRLLSKELLSFGAQLRVGVESPPTNRAGPFSEPMGIMRDRTDTMMSNPLYGSSDKFVNSDGSMSLAGYGRGAYHDGIVNDPLRVDITDSMVANPVYGEHMAPRIPGVSAGSTGLTPDNRPVSPLDNVLVANPLYGDRQDLDSLQLQSKEMEGKSKSTTNTDGRNLQSADLDDKNISSNQTESTDGSDVVGRQTNAEEKGRSEGHKDSPPCDSEEATSTPTRSSNGVKDSQLSVEKGGSVVDGTHSQPSGSGAAGGSAPRDPRENGSCSPSTTSTSEKEMTTPVHTNTENTSPSSSDTSARPNPSPAKVGHSGLTSDGLRRGLSPGSTSSASDKGASPIHSDHTKATAKWTRPARWRLRRRGREKEMCPLHHPSHLGNTATMTTASNIIRAS